MAPEPNREVSTVRKQPALQPTTLPLPDEKAVENGSRTLNSSPDAEDLPAATAAATQSARKSEEPDFLDQIEDKVTVWPATKEGIDGAVGEVLRDILSCYQRALNAGVEMDGTLDVEFVIAESDGLGSVREVDIVDGSFEYGPTEDCLMDVMSVLQFDPPEGGEKSVHYPFEFSMG